MLTFFLSLLAAWLAQPLDGTQHAALMNVYDGLGCSSSSTFGCPRFAAHENCTDSLAGVLECRNGSVIEIRVKGGIYGTISSAIGALSSLITLSLSESRLTGTLTSALGQLTELRSLSLNDNQLFGAIPDSFSRLTRLYTLQLQNNGLTGTLPLLPMLRSCFLRQPVDGNAFDCSMAPVNCSCFASTIAPFCPPALNLPSSATACDATQPCPYACSNSTDYANCVLVATSLPLAWNLTCGPTLPITGLSSSTAGSLSSTTESSTRSSSSTAGPSGSTVGPPVTPSCPSSWIAVNPVPCSATCGFTCSMGVYIRDCTLLYSMPTSSRVICSDPKLNLALTRTLPPTSLTTPPPPPTTTTFLTTRPTSTTWPTSTTTFGGAVTGTASRAPFCPPGSGLSPTSVDGPCFSNRPCVYKCSRSPTEYADCYLVYTTATAEWNLRCGDLQSIVTLPATTAESSEIVSEPLPSGIDAATVGIIAGVIGGVLLLVIAGLAVFVCRNKRTRTAQPSVEVPSQMSIYGPVDLPPPSNYSSAPPIERSNTYDFLTPAEAMQK